MKKYILLFTFIVIYVILAMFYSDAFSKNISNDFYDYLKADLRGHSNGIVSVLNAYVYTDNIKSINDIALMDKRALDLSDFIKSIETIDASDLSKKLNYFEMKELNFLIIDTSGNIINQYKETVVDKSELLAIIDDLNESKASQFKVLDDLGGTIRGYARYIYEDSVLMTYYQVSAENDMSLVEAARYLNKNIEDIDDKILISLISKENLIYYATDASLRGKVLKIFDYDLRDIDEGKFINLKNEELKDYKYFFLEPLESSELFLMTAVKDDTVVEHLDSIMVLEMIIFFINILVIIVIGVLFDSKWIKRST